MDTLHETLKKMQYAAAYGESGGLASSLVRMGGDSVLSGLVDRFGHTFDEQGRFPLSVQVSVGWRGPGQYKLILWGSEGYTHRIEEYRHAYSRVALLKAAGAIKQKYQAGRLAGVVKEAPWYVRGRK